MSKLSDESSLSSDSSDSESYCSTNPSTPVNKTTARKRLFEDLELSASPLVSTPKKAALTVDPPPSEVSAPSKVSLPVEVSHASRPVDKPCSSKDVAVVDLDNESSFDLSKFSLEKANSSDFDEKKVMNIMQLLGLSTKHCNFFNILPSLIFLKCQNDLHFYVAPFRNIKSKLTPRFFYEFQLCHKCNVPTKMSAHFFIPSFASVNPRFTRSLKTVTSQFETLQVGSVQKSIEISCDLLTALSTLIASKYSNARIYTWRDSNLKNSRGSPLDLLKGVFIEGNALEDISSVAFYQRESELCTKKAFDIFKNFEKSEFVDIVIAYEQAGENIKSATEKAAIKSVVPEVIKITGLEEKNKKDSLAMKQVEKAVQKLSAQTIANPNSGVDVAERKFERAARELANYDTLISKHENKILKLIARTEKGKTKLKKLYERRNRTLDQLRREPNSVIFSDK